MTDPLPITPFRGQLDSTVQLPGSKSITNRALILAALAEGTTRLEGALFSRDTRIMLSALKTLGFDCQVDEASRSITLAGGAGKIPATQASIDVGNAGTAARFLTAFLALQPGGSYQLDGDPAMRERPMQGLIQALEDLGAAEFEFHGEAGFFPFTLHSKGYRGGEATVDASASSQILSALLLAAPAGQQGVRLHCPGVRPAYVAITLKMREAFGAPEVQADPTGCYALDGQLYQAPTKGIYTIEPDISAASYFLALTLIHGGKLTLSKLGPDPLQGDALFADVLAHHGLRVDADTQQWIASNSTPNAIERGHREIDFNTFSDTFLTYAAIAPLLGGSVRITGIGHTRHQETDRIAGMANELSKLGQLVKEEEDALTIGQKPNELRSRALHARNHQDLLEIETYDDHRFAMSFAILGSYDLLGDGEPWLAIKDPSCCGKTFPQFLKYWRNCVMAEAKKSIIVAVDGGAATGKSSTSRQLAERFDLMHVDTGSHYRTLTHALLEQGASPDEASQFDLSKLVLGTELDGRSARLSINGKTPEDADIRSPAVNAAVSKFAAIPEIRAALFDYQRAQAEVAINAGFHGLIMEGRDIGSVIFPDADHRFSSTQMKPHAWHDGHLRGKQTRLLSVTSVTANARLPHSPAQRVQRASTPARKHLKKWSTTLLA